MEPAWAPLLMCSEQQPFAPKQGYRSFAKGWMNSSTLNKLFWVYTKDHDEDDFVVASSSLAARRFFEDYVGYNPNQAKAKFIEDVPSHLSSEEGYADDELLQKLGFTLVCESMPTIYAKGGQTYVSGCVNQNTLLSLAAGNSGVYCVRCAGSLFVKIGKTSDVSRRLKELQTGCPYRLILDFFITCAKPRIVEEQLHQRLSFARTQFEWFEVHGREYDQLRSDVRKLTSDNQDWKLLEYLLYVPP